jgi:hypothetical protein
MIADLTEKISNSQLIRSVHSGSVMLEFFFDKGITTLYFKIKVFPKKYSEVQIQPT